MVVNNSTVVPQVNSVVDSSMAKAKASTDLRQDTVDSRNLSMEPTEDSKGLVVTEHRVSIAGNSRLDAEAN